jgi:hypothetical protein
MYSTTRSKTGSLGQAVCLSCKHFAEYQRIRVGASVAPTSASALMKSPAIADNRSSLFSFCENTGGATE